jgi:hypothetical protein
MVAMPATTACARPGLRDMVGQCGRDGLRPPSGQEDSGEGFPNCSSELGSPRRPPLAITTA